jgi:hypothetical protein
MIRKELRVWERMDHENILPLLGFMIKDGVPALISEWLENGTVTSYLNTHKEADRFAMVRMPAAELSSRIVLIL